MLNQFRRARNLQRFNKIVSVLARHGFGSILQYLRVNRYLPLPPTLLKQSAQPAHLTPAEHFRLALEELGPTFVKLGQILSTRPDIVPPQYISELIKLQDGVAPTSWEAVREVLRGEYGEEPERIFSEIDHTPLASASLAQVHAAVLPDGSQVVIKVQRPKILQTINSDLDILNDLARLAQRTTWGQLYNPVEIVSQFAFTLHNELDYRREGLNADRFRSNFAGDPLLYIPKVYWDYSTACVLVLERIEGIKVDNLAELEAAGYSRHKVALNASGILVKEIMENGFFHADPHPGNFLVMPGEVIGAMDFGMVGHVSKTDRLNMIQAYSLAAKLDAKGLVEHMLRMGSLPPQVDLQGLERDLDRLLNQYHDLPLKYIQPRQLLEDVMHIAFAYRVILPPDIWLLFKTMTMIDGLARQLDPEVNVISIFGPHVRRIMVEMHLPWVWGPAFVSDLESLALIARDIPGIGENLLRGLQRGELPFSVNMGASKETLDRLDRLSTRISLSVLAAAFILGLALMLPLASGSSLAMFLVVVGFLMALSLGAWLVISILRSGK